MKKWSDEEIQGYIIDWHDYDEEGIVAQGIEIIQQLLDERRWIPVSERLPDESGDYQVFFQHRIGILHFNNQWYWGDESAMDDETQKDVTYWQPLPPPPKEEG